MDGNNGAVLGLPQAGSKDFDLASAGTYNAIYYEKLNAQMQNNVEVGTPVQGKASITVDSAGKVTITDSQSNKVMASGTLGPVADVSYIYDGTANTMPDPCYGIFTFRTATPPAAPTLQQDVLMAFQGNAIIFSSFQTALPVQNNGAYTYFYGVGLK